MINDDRGAGEGVYRDGGDRFIDAQQDDCDVCKLQQMDHARMPVEFGTKVLNLMSSEQE